MRCLKYKIGDTVWIMNTNRACKLTVVDCEITKMLSEPEKEYYEYHCKPVGRFFTSLDFYSGKWRPEYYRFAESELHESKEALLNSLA